ncbi:MAG: phosphoenolpyruvate carboxykinase [Hyphomicrobiales bacterium]|nr:phosphoenolpyruvate carboxykinase [Hyphomicrobiales bacterium]
MKQTGDFNPAYGADKFGFKDLAGVAYNFEAPFLYEESMRRKEATLAAGGAIVAETGVHTGRSPKDKFVVDDALTHDTVWWDNNGRMTKENFDALLADFIAHAKGKDLFAQDLYGGADHHYRVKTRVFTEYAWHSLFIRTLLIRPERDELAGFVPDLTIVDLPSFRADPKRHGCRSETVIAIDFTRKIVLIGGSSYAGEMKKSVFTYLNYVLPAQHVMPMHCSANVGGHNDAAVFFGLSGTGKTTLSADPDRVLLGDDEHGWSKDGIFNFEGGCYAKAIKLSEEAEPQIFATTKRFGTVMENVVLDPITRVPDFDDASKTENTRIAYPLDFIPNASATGRAHHPKNIVMLTCDAFGVLPPIAKLDPSQAMYHFLSGYTAKVAGTEKGVTEPQATFSTCFGAPFMPLHPTVYAKMLGEKMARQHVKCWLVNTGWSGGGFGVGNRMSIKYTRAMVKAALDGTLASIASSTDPHFGMQVPNACPEVPGDVLNPRNTWKDKKAYDSTARDLTQRFEKNFQQFEGHVDGKVKQAAIRAAA